MRNFKYVYKSFRLTNPFPEDYNTPRHYLQWEWRLQGCTPGRRVLEVSIGGSVENSEDFVSNLSDSKVGNLILIVKLVSDKSLKSI